MRLQEGPHLALANRVVEADDIEVEDSDANRLAHLVGEIAFKLMLLIPLGIERFLAHATAPRGTAIDADDRVRVGKTVAVSRHEVSAAM